MAKKKNTVLYILLITILVFAPSMVAYAATDVTLAWDPSSGTVTGYRLYYGTSSGVYPDSIDVGNVTQYTVTGLQEGTTYYFVVRAYNDYGESGNSNEIKWTANAPNAPPTAAISASPTSGNAPLLVNFNGNGQDSDGSIVSWQWNFGDGSTSTSQNCTHTYQDVKSETMYTVVLKVTDNGGATGQKSITVTVLPSGTPPHPPIGVTVD